VRPSALHDFIVLGLYNAFYIGFICEFTGCSTIGVSNNGQNLNSIQTIVFGW